MNKTFQLSDLVVWNGVIASYGSIAPLISSGDDVRLANQDERKEYSQKNE